ncbi:MAG: phosphatase PAP2 family protein [candidate division KSB1 bacterium]|nr:phosphatase PAP2 family protein [candidate division KSB1 bacterium]
MRKILILLCVLGSASAAPFESNTETDLALGAAGLTSGVVSLFVQSQLPALTETEIQQLKVQDIHRLDRPAVWMHSEKAVEWSDYLLFSCAALPLLSLAHTDMRGDAGTLALMYAETAVLTAGVTNLTKVLVRRTRPYVYFPDRPIQHKLEKDARKSFFSGHTSLAFATATYTATVTSEYLTDNTQRTGVWGGCMALASSVAVCRVLGGRHFPTDVIAGALAGGLIGYVVPALHRQNGEKTAQTPLLRVSFRW